jgi:putrescine transport system ATP-binding protein
MAEDDVPKIEAPAEEVKAEPPAAPPSVAPETVAEQVLMQTAAPPEAVAEQVLLQAATPPEAVLEQVLSQTATPPEAAPPPPAPEVVPPQPAPVAQAPGWDGPLLRIEGVVKKFGGFRAVDGVSLDIRAGEFFALLGPSGCGKTTLLRMLAGFETPDEGQILLAGRDIAHVLPHERPINMMFQSYALFPHLSVRDNIAFGLRRAGMARADIDARVAEMVALVKLGGLEKRKPDRLSGGQRQRVALARSLARRPQVLLLDEPLAALDKKLRESTQLELMELQRRLGMTFIIVTHDQEEAMTVASRIGVMDAGRLDQVASPRELYEAPASRWIAEFIGDINVFEGEVASRENNRITIATRDAGNVVVAEPRQPIARATVAVAIRPEKVKLSRRGPASNPGHALAINRLEGVVTDVSYLGGLTTYKIKLDSGATMRSSMANTARIDIDAYSLSQRVVAWFTPDDCMVLQQ